METLTLTISGTLLEQVAPYQADLGELLRLGLRQVKMSQYAVAQGLRATVDDETIC